MIINGEQDVTKAVLQRSPWVGEFDPLAGIVLHDQIDPLLRAAE